MQGPSALLNVLTIPPGASSTQERIVIDGIRGAIFLYDNTGALVGSESPVSGTDNASNAYLAGKATYFDSGLGYLLACTNNGSQVIFYTALTSAGPWTQLASMSSSQSGDIILQPSAGRSVNLTNLIVTGKITSTSGTQANPTLITTDTWHNFAYSNGWAAGANGAQYRLTAQGDLQISAQFTPGTTTNGTTIATLPAGWRPATGKAVPCYGDGTAATGGNPYLFVNTNGTITVHWVTATQTVIYCEGSIRLT